MTGGADIPSARTLYSSAREQTTGGFPRTAPHHHCPLSAHINQKHLVLDVLEQPSRLSPVSFSISGECSTGINWGCVGEKEKCKTWLNTSERHSQEKIKPALGQLDYTRHAPERLHRELSISATQGFQTELIPFPSVEAWVKPFSFSWPSVYVI